MNKYQILSIIFSLFALLIASATLYFQFFYKTHEIRLSVISTNVNFQESMLETKIIYHNNGNIYTTITQNFLIFYQNDNDYFNEGIIFSTEEQKVVKKFIYDPLVIIPGEQRLKSINTIMNFEIVDFEQYNIDKSEPLKAGLQIGFLNNEGMQTTELVELGWITINSELKIDKYKFSFTSRKLEGYGYLSSSELN